MGINRTNLAKVRVSSMSYNLKEASGKAKALEI